MTVEKEEEERPKTAQAEEHVDEQQTAEGIGNRLNISSLQSYP